MVQSNPMGKKENVMPEFWKDGEEIKCRSIDSKGYVGQPVVLSHAHFEENSGHPLACYSQPSVLVIVGKTEKVYVLKDADGNQVEVGDKHYGASCDCLYDANTWAKWMALHEKEKLRRKQNKIERLEGQVALLKDILVKQGVRIVTAQQAQELGIE